jgi:hypothetical protein
MFARQVGLPVRLRPPRLLGGFRWNVDPAPVLAASHLCGNRAVGGRVADSVRTVRSTRIVDVGGANEQEWAVCLPERCPDEGGVKQAEGGV